jgi:hypothetical protein
MAIGHAPNPSDFTAGFPYLLGPIRSILGGLFKSPNRLRWLAHSARTPVSRLAQAAGCCYKPRTDSIVLHRRFPLPARAHTQYPGGLI